MDPLPSSMGQVQGVLDSAPGPAQSLQIKRHLPLLLYLLLLLPTVSHGRNFLHQVCGKHRLKGRDLRNENTWEGKWPWQVSLQYGNHPLCEGTLIDFQWVLTASHCFPKTSDRTSDLTAYHVLVGSHKLYEISPKSLSVRVKRIFRYPDSPKIPPFAHDIALLLLEWPVKLSPYAVPICLPRAGLNFEEKASCWMTGWERVDHIVLLVKASFLREVQVPFIKNRKCNVLYTSTEDSKPSTMGYEIEDDMLCEGGIINPTGICMGNVGSPLVCEFSKIWTQVAMVSWSTQCSPTYLTIFTRLIPYLNWIERTKKIMSGKTDGSEEKSANVSRGYRAGTCASVPILLVPLQMVFLHWLFGLGLLMAPWSLLLPQFPLTLHPTPHKFFFVSSLLSFLAFTRASLSTHNIPSSFV